MISSIKLNCLERDIKRVEAVAEFGNEIVENEHNNHINQAHKNDN